MDLAFRVIGAHKPLIVLINHNWYFMFISQQELCKYKQLLQFSILSFMQQNKQLHVNLYFTFYLLKVYKSGLEFHGFYPGQGSVPNKNVPIDILSLKLLMSNEQLALETLLVIWQRPGSNSMALLTSEFCAYDRDSPLTCKFAANP